MGTIKSMTIKFIPGLQRWFNINIRKVTKFINLKNSDFRH